VLVLQFTIYEKRCMKRFDLSKAIGIGAVIFSLAMVANRVGVC
jgi:hypothetical protein